MLELKAEFKPLLEKIFWNEEVCPFLEKYFKGFVVDKPDHENAFLVYGKTGNSVLRFEPIFHHSDNIQTFWSCIALKYDTCLTSSRNAVYNESLMWQIDNAKRTPTQMTIIPQAQQRAQIVFPENLPF